MLEVIINGSLVNSWYNWWLPVVGFGVAVILGAIVLGRSSYGITGLIAKAISATAILAALPLAMERLGLNIAISDQLTVAYLSMGGTLAAVVIGLPFLLVRRAIAQEYGHSQATVAFRKTDGFVDHSKNAVEFAKESATIVAPLTGKEASSSYGAGQARTIKLDNRPGGIRIGRASYNDIIVNDNMASRDHATIRYINGNYVLEDKGSSNGTIVSGRKVSNEVLSADSRIKIGDTELVLEIPETVSRSNKGVSHSASNKHDLIPGIYPVPEAPGQTIVAKPQTKPIGWFAVKSGPEAGKTFQLSEKNLTIGRDSSNDIVINDPSVSRRHACLRYNNGEFVLADLGSRSGTYVNEQQVSGLRLSSGASLKVGDSELTLIEVDAVVPNIPQGDTTNTIVASPARSTGVLLVKSGPDAGKSFHLKEGDNLLGRDSSNSVLLSDPSVSRSHCIIRCEGNVVTVYDLASSAGTKIDGKSASGSHVGVGDNIALGQSGIILVKAA